MRAQKKSYFMLDLRLNSFEIENILIFKVNDMDLNILSLKVLTHELLVGVGTRLAPACSRFS